MEWFSDWKAIDWLTAALALATFFLGWETQGVRIAAERDRIESDRRYRTAALPQVEVIGLQTHSYQVNVDPTRQFTLQLRNVGAVATMVWGSGFAGRNSELVEIGDANPRIFVALEQTNIPITVRRHHPADVDISITVFLRSLSTGEQALVVRRFRLSGPWDYADVELVAAPDKVTAFTPTDDSRDRGPSPPFHWLKWRRGSRQK